MANRGEAEKILIVRTGAMGDILHALPAVAALRSAMPEAHLGWVVDPRWAPLLQNSAGESPLVDMLHFAETKAWSKSPFSHATAQSLIALRHSLRAEKYTAAIDLQGSLRSAVLARFSGASRIFGSATPREGAARWLYTQVIATTATHVIDQAREIAQAYSSLDRNTVKEGELLPPTDAAAERWLRMLTAGDTRKLVLLAPAAGWGAKQWPDQSYGKVATELTQRGYRVLVNAIPGTGEQADTFNTDPLAASVVTASGNTAEAVQCTLPQLIALTRRVDLVLAGDTGPLHLADALGIPSVALFGPTDPARTGPYHAPHHILRHPTSVTDHGRYKQTESGLKQITTAEVTEAVLDLLEGMTTA